MKKDSVTKVNVWNCSTVAIPNMTLFLLAAKQLFGLFLWTEAGPWKVKTTNVMSVTADLCCNWNEAQHQKSKRQRAPKRNYSICCFEPPLSLSLLSFLLGRLNSSGLIAFSWNDRGRLGSHSRGSFYKALYPSFRTPHRLPHSAVAWMVNTWHV